MAKAAEHSAQFDTGRYWESIQRRTEVESQKILEAKKGSAFFASQIF